ncbi:MAG: response regulator, partial [Bacteroidota bacterium]
CDSGGAALEYLTGNNQEPQPGIILLDLNMPGMNGWEFLDHYEKIPLEKRLNTVLAILTTSVNPDDKIKAQKRPTVKEFFSKPLKKEHIETLISTHFEN